MSTTRRNMERRVGDSAIASQGRGDPGANPYEIEVGWWTRKFQWYKDILREKTGRVSDV